MHVWLIRFWKKWFLFASAEVLSFRGLPFMAGLRILGTTDRLGLN